MLDPADFVSLLKSEEINFFAGVPDSLLKNFLSYLLNEMSEKEHVVCANEGSAVALACGYHIATGKTACVYLQNSGLGNAINPLISLADPLVFKIPILLLVGYRGEKGTSDEPQHIKQGAISENLLDALEIPFEILNANSNAAELLSRARTSMESRGGAYVLLVRKNTFSNLDLESGGESNIKNAIDPVLLSREEAIAHIAESLPGESIVVASTGKISRELYEYRKASKSEHKRDFYCVGGMGHASQIALGIAMQAGEMPVICLDGDGAALMHLGHLAGISAAAPPNLVHVILNNRVHESVGGQPTVHPQADFAGLAKVLGYKNAIKISNKQELEAVLKRHAQDWKAGPSLWELIVSPGSRENLARPQESPEELKRQLMESLQAGKLTE